MEQTTLPPPPPPQPEEDQEPPSEPSKTPRRVDMRISASDVGPDSAVVRWRPFSAEEREAVDGVQLRYAEVNQHEHQHQHQHLQPMVPKTSPFLHRDTNFYVLVSEGI